MIGVGAMIDDDVGINLVVENKDCKHCDMKLVNWFEYGQVCKRSRKRKQIDNQTKYFTRSWPLHKQIEKILTESLTKILMSLSRITTPRYWIPFIYQPLAQSRPFSKQEEERRTHILPILDLRFWFKIIN